MGNIPESILEGCNNTILRQKPVERRVDDTESVCPWERNPAAANIWKLYAAKKDKKDIK